MYTIYVTTFQDGASTEVCSIFDKDLCMATVEALKRAIDIKSIDIVDGLTGEVLSTVKREYKFMTQTEWVEED